MSFLVMGDRQEPGGYLFSKWSPFKLCNIWLACVWEGPVPCGEGAWVD